MGSFRDKFRKAVTKIDGASTDDPTPKFWISFGNYVINKIMSGDWDRGIPQGRITGLSGPSGSGKSFLIANAIKWALNNGYQVVVIDSEQAMDPDFLRAVGVDIDSEFYEYSSAKNMSSATKLFQSITKFYNEARKTEDYGDLRPLLIVIDSLDFLFVDGMLEDYEKTGEVSSDQGLHSKKLKQLLNLIVADIKHIPAAVIVTKQVYVDQEKYASPPWKMAESVKYAMSQLALLTRLISKDKTTKLITGIKLKVFGWKTRFTRPFQQVELEIPYDTGLDLYEGLLPVAKSLGIVTVSGSWNVFNGKKFYSNDFPKYQEEIFQAIKALEKVDIDAVSDDVVEECISEKKAKKTMRDKLAALKEAGKIAPEEDTE